MTQEELKKYTTIDNEGNVSLTVSYEEFTNLCWAIECAIEAEADFQHRNDGRNIVKTEEEWQEIKKKLDDQVYKEN